MSESEPFSMDPKHAGPMAVVMMAAGAVFWAVTGRVGAGASLMAVGAFLSVVAVIIAARRKG